MGVRHAFAVGCALVLVAAACAIAAGSKGDFEVLVVDDQGRPVEGASVGLTAGFNDLTFKNPHPWYYVNPDGPLDDRSSERGLLSDREGRVKLRGLTEHVKHFGGVVARHEQRGLAGIGEIKADGEAADAKTITVRLQPACRVTLRLKSDQLAAAGKPFDRCHIMVWRGKHLRYEFCSVDPALEFSLPPGEFELEIASGDTATYPVKHRISIPAGQRELDLKEIDLPASHVKLLEGQPAPPLRDVVAWKNSPPLDLSALRGKVVLLDFWGWWCTACVDRMPELFKLHDKHAGQLAIIGVHIDVDDGIDTAAKLDAKLAETRRHIWQGRDVPYPVALIRRKQVPFATNHPAESRPKASCQTAADYGVIHYPFYILIDRQGRVIGKFYPNEEGLKRLEAALQEGAGG